MDELALIGLQYHAPHGVHKSEKEAGNNFEVDIIFGLDASESAATDHLSATIDYQQAEHMVRGVMEQASVNLIERLCQQTGAALFAHFTQAQKLTVRVRKLHPPLQTTAAYAQIERTWNR